MAGGGGAFLIAWMTVDPAYEVRAARMPLSGDAAGAPLVLGKSGLPSAKGPPGVAWTGTGFAVVWARQPYGLTRLETATVSGDGTVAGPNVLFTAANYHYLSYVRLFASPSAGNLLLSYVDDVTYGPSGPYTAILTASLDPGLGAPANFQAIDTVNPYSSDPQLAFDGQSWVLTWGDWGSGPGGIEQAHISEDGGQTTKPVLLGGLPSTQGPAAVTAWNGDYIVVWADDVQQGPHMPHVLLRILTAEGKPTGAVADISGTRGTDPAVATASSTVMAAWRWQPINEQDDALFDMLVARRVEDQAFTSTFILVAPERTANSPRIASDGQRYLVGWTHRSGPDGDTDVRATLVQQAGVHSGWECASVGGAGCCMGNTATWCNGTSPTAAPCATSCGWSAADGGYRCGGSGADPSGVHPLECETPVLVPGGATVAGAPGEDEALCDVAASSQSYAVLYTHTASGPSQLRAVMVTAEGAPDAARTQTLGTLAAPGGCGAVAYGQGTFLAVWADAAGGLLARRMGPDLAPIDQEPIVVTTATSAHPSVTFDGQQFVVAWVEPTHEGPPVTGDAWMATVSLDGEVPDPPVRVAQATYPDAKAPDLEIKWAVGEGPQRLASVGDGTALRVGLRRAAFSMPGATDEHPRPRVFVQAVEATGAPLALGTPCLDDASCTSGWCVAGVCCEGAGGGGLAGDCAACSVAAGAAADGTCTAVSAPPGACDDGDACTDDACLPGSGCLHEAIPGPCDDGDVCTTGDACTASGCVGTKAPCDDGDPCTLDLCDSSTGCQHPLAEGSPTTTWRVADEDRAPGSVFGSPLAMDGDRLAVGVGTPTGVEIWERAGDQWALAATVPWPDPTDPTNLASLGLRGDTLAIGSTTGTWGRVWIYRLSGGQWTEEQLLQADSHTAGIASDQFGVRLSLDQDAVLVAAPGSTTRAAYLFERAGTSWTLAATLKSPLGGIFPGAVTLGGSLAVAVVPTLGPHLWRKEGGSWVAKGVFGSGTNPTVAIGDGMVAVGMPFAAGTYTYEGGVALFEITPEGVVQTGVIGSPLPAPYGKFGAAVALASGRLVVASALPTTAWIYGVGGGQASPLGTLETPGGWTAGWSPTLAQASGDLVAVPALSSEPWREVWVHELPHDVVCGGGCDSGSCWLGECVGGGIDCDDENPCTTDGCGDGGGCTHVATVEACDDGDACTSGDACSGGVCVPGAPVDCDDGEPCTTDACDTAAGCVHGANAVPCDDGDACTEGDACADGACASGAAIGCDDGDPCTDDACDTVAGCVHVANSVACDDGDACTANDACSEGACVAGTALDCDDGEPCTDDACDPAAGCAHSSNTAPCDDGDACTSGDACHLGQCAAGAAVNCSDDDACTEDSCNPATGCIATPIAGCCNSDADCPAPPPCVAVACDAASHACVSTPVDGCCTTDAQCDDGHPCTADTCDASAGECLSVVMEGCCEADADCDDGLDCTLDTCESNACVHTPMSAGCDDADACTDDGCSTETGCSHTANTALCDDGDACTEGDGCAAGACVPGAPVSCDDGDVCTEDACDPATGCTVTPVPGCCATDADCDDGAVCTADSCDPATGACSHAPVSACCTADTDCDDGAVCTADACDPATGACSHAPVAGCCAVDTDCDDGAVCTADACDPATGACSHAPVSACSSVDTDCDDGVVCTADTCDPATGACSHAPVAACCAVDAACDDGAVCTADSCDPATGACSHAPVSGCCTTDADCDDGVACTIDTCLDAACLRTPSPAACDDAEPCTTDTCETDAGCVHAAASGPCDDGDSCTQGDACDDGACAKGEPLWCDDGLPCTTDGCIPQTGCTHEPASGPCDDGDPCTTGDACSDGACSPGGPMACDDGDPCTGDACVEGVCVFTPLDGCCTGDTDCADELPCTADACDPATRTCTHEPVQGCCVDDGGCTDGVACTKDACIEGLCAHEPLDVVCGDGGACAFTVCNPAKGCEVVPVTGPCDDGDPCTTGDACTEGACDGGSFITCDDGDPCTADLCWPGAGCTSSAAPGTCDDGDPCTGVGACEGGICTPGAPLSCDDGDPCTADACTLEQGCASTPQPDACDDFDPCTEDSCDSKKGCTHAHVAGCCQSDTQCATGKPCVTTSCDPASHTCVEEDLGGCCETDDACADDDPCTEDLCLRPEGVCLHTVSPACCTDATQCDDGAACTEDHCEDGACTHTAIVGCIEVVTEDTGPDEPDVGQGAGAPDDLQPAPVADTAPAAGAPDNGCAAARGGSGASLVTLLALLLLVRLVRRPRAAMVAWLTVAGCTEPGPSSPAAESTVADDARDATPADGAQEGEDALPDASLACPPGEAPAADDSGCVIPGPLGCGAADGGAECAIAWCRPSSECARTGGACLEDITACTTAEGGCEPGTWRPPWGDGTCAPAGAPSLGASGGIEWCVVDGVAGLCGDGEPGCPAGERPEDGKCIAAGAAMVCPTGFREVPAQGPPNGALPACEPDPDDCLPWEPLPGAVHVSAAKAGPLPNGTFEHPYPSLAAAISAAGVGGTVFVDAGLYPADLLMGAPVTLRGRCAALVTVTTATPGDMLNIAANAKPGSVRLERLRLAPTSTGLAVKAPLGVEMDRVWIDGAEIIAVGALGEGAWVSLRRTVIRGVKPAAGSPTTYGVLALDGAAISLDEVRITDVLDNGIQAIGTDKGKPTVELRNVVIDAIDSVEKDSADLSGVGVSAINSERLDAVGLRVANVNGVGMYVNLTPTVLRGVRIEDVAEQSKGIGTTTGKGGLGLVVFQSDLLLAGSTIRANRRGGILLSHSTSATVLGVTVEGSPEAHPAGIAEVGLAVGMQTDVSVIASEIEGVPGIGARIDGIEVQMRASALRIDGTRHSEKGGEPGGLGLVTRGHAQTELRGVTITDSATTGVLTEGSGRLDAEGLLVEATGPGGARIGVDSGDVGTRVRLAGAVVRGFDGADLRVTTDALVEGYGALLEGPTEGTVTGTGAYSAANGELHLFASIVRNEPVAGVWVGPGGAAVVMDSIIAGGGADGSGGGDGVIVSDPANVSIERTTIADHPRAGVLLLDHAAATLQRVSVTGNAVGVAVHPGAEALVIESALFGNQDADMAPSSAEPEGDAP